MNGGSCIQQKWNGMILDKICLDRFAKSNSIQFFSNLIISCFLFYLLFDILAKLLFNNFISWFFCRLDENGEINRISYSNQVRDSFMTTVAPDNVKQFYKALLLMDKLLYENVLHYKLNAGTLFQAIYMRNKSRISISN